MRRLMVVVAVVLGMFFLTGETWAAKRIVVRRDAAERFIVLPDGVRHPEGIAANPDTGELYVGTFDFGPNTNKLLRYDRNGHLLATKDFGGTPLLGLEFRDGKVYICNFGAGKIQRIAGNFTASTAVEDVATLPNIGAPADRFEPNPDGSQDQIIFGSNGVPAVNATVFNAAGDLFVSDSFQGAVFKIASATTCTTPCAMTTVSHDPLLATTGFPPFGANGLALSLDGKTLFIANTGDDRVLRLDLASGTVGVFAESINGADGVTRDAEGRLWVAANQADEIVVLNHLGRPIAKLGDFLGIRNDGTPDGLLFPASIVIVGRHAFVTNLAIALTPAVGDEPEEDVTRWTISRIAIPDELPAP
jgi:sugar lactone lactonase YvrE